MLNTKQNQFVIFSMALKMIPNLHEKVLENVEAM
jgi:hypothetical protein